MTIPCIRLCQPPASYQNMALLGLDFLFLNNPFDHSDVDKNCNYLTLPTFLAMSGPRKHWEVCGMIMLLNTKVYYSFLHCFLLITITVFFDSPSKTRI